MAIDLKQYDPALMAGASIGVAVDLADIADSSGNEVIEIDGVTSAVNYVRVTNAATGANPEMTAQGDDTNIGLTLGTKGTTGMTLDVDAVTTGTAVALNSTALTTGVALDIDVAGLTTGKGIDLSNLAAVTTGKAIHVDATGTTHTTGILVHIDSAGTAITGAGRLFLSDHTGVTGSTAILNEFKSAANDETEIVTITATDALALGKALNISVAAVTTGTALNISDGNAFTTGNMVVFASNSSNTGTRSVVQIKQDHASASGATALEVWQDGALAAIKLTGNPTIGIDLTAMANTEQSINFTAGTGSTAAPQTNAPVGFIKVGVAGTAQWIPYYDAT